MRLPWIAIIAGIVLVSLTAAADEARSRQQALRDLGHADIQVRRAAAVRLGSVGRAFDVPALMRALRDPDEETRAVAESSIWSVWGRSGDSEIDALYQRGVDAMNSGQASEAIETFTLIIRRKPQFAEAWNKRATLYYFTGELEKSLRDCDEVIKRVPLHFGALAGYGLIYSQLDQPERALDYFRRALAINPNMHGVASNIERLQRLIDGKRKRYVLQVKTGHFNRAGSEPALGIALEPATPGANALA